jgi:hypothetical protein
MLPKADYALLEDPDVVARVRSDPQGFLGALRTPVILDEVQNAVARPSSARLWFASYLQCVRVPRSRGCAAPSEAGRFRVSRFACVRRMSI